MSCDACCVDVLDRKCCQVDCYTLVDCKLAHSHQCTSAPVQCASGKLLPLTILHLITDDVTDTHTLATGVTRDASQFPKHAT